MKKILVAAILLFPSISYANEGDINVVEEEFVEEKESIEQVDYLSDNQEDASKENDGKKEYTEEEVVEDVEEENLEEKNDSNKNLELVKYDTIVNDYEKPEFSDLYMKTNEAVVKYATMFASRYEWIDVDPEHSIYVEDILDMMCEDPDVVVNKEIFKQAPHLKEATIQNLHRYLPIFVDDAEFEGMNSKVSYYKDGRYYIPTKDQSKEQTVEKFDNEYNGKRYVSIKSVNEKEYKEVVKKANEVVDKYINNKMSDKQKAEVLAKYLVENVDYDYGTSIKKPIRNDEYGALITGGTHCDGVARAYSMLMRRAGIPTYTVYGRLKQGGNHAWNVVRMDNRWLLVDLTHSLNSNKINPKHFLKTYKELDIYDTIKESTYGGLLEATKK